MKKIQQTFFVEILSPKGPLKKKKKIPLLTQRPLFFVIFASPNAPYIENQGLTPASVLYSSAPPPGKEH